MLRRGFHFREILLQRRPSLQECGNQLLHMYLMSNSRHFSHPISNCVLTFPHLVEAFIQSGLQAANLNSTSYKDIKINKTFKNINK